MCEMPWKNAVGSICNFAANNSPSTKPFPFIAKNSLTTNLPFTFPKKIKLKKTMSDIFGGFCSKDLGGKEERKIGFTLRVGGSRSGINDRRNWDGYIVDKKVIRINPKFALEMMGFPRNFIFPVSDNQLTHAIILSAGFANLDKALPWFQQSEQVYPLIAKALPPKASRNNRPSP